MAPFDGGEPSAAADGGSSAIMEHIATRPTSRASNQLISRVPYLPGLDGMRAVAVLAVMVYHAHLWLSAGFLGVEVFFVISGYLITLLLIAEHEREHRVHLGQFWLRRFRRLLPALYVALVMVSLYCLLFFRDALGKLRGDVLAAATYSTNWYQIWSGQSYTGEFDFVPLRHLWSLAVEEQFYLFWPLVMLVILRRGRARLPRVGMWLLGISIAITIGTAIFFHPGATFSCADVVQGREQLGPPCTVEFLGRAIEKNNFLYLGTISRMSGILLGAGFAMLWRPLAIVRGPLRHKSRQLDLLGLAGLALFGLLAWKYELFSAFTSSWYGPIFRGGFFLTGLATLAIIAAVTHPGSILGKVLGNPVLNWVGTRSYGLYLFHWPIYQFIRNEAGIQLSVPQLLAAWAATGIIAEASYRFVETPIRKGHLSAWWHRRRAMGYAQRRRVMLGATCSCVLLGVLGVSLALAPVKCTNNNECAFEAGKKAMVATTTTAPVGATNPGGVVTTIAGIPESTVLGETTTTTVPATTTTLPKVKYPIYAIGDSVMLGAAPTLQSAGIVVDAAVSRQATTGADIIEGVVAQELLGDYVVVHLGTNGPMSSATLERLMAATASAKVVVVLTDKAARGWTEGNNALIRALPGNHPNVVVVDWQAEAGAHPEFITGDGIHLKNDAARKFYTNLVLGALGFPQIP
ncbi:unannotated protein [freshwater metagenome]|uniref:Unannotated protein n=1 Tax=freshwater metagenome TaxID=449393 RepID=A0A6J7F872_9ZZZZ|nr:acyltransferase family protein [Actinomycetota bacterium]